MVKEQGVNKAVDLIEGVFFKSLAMQGLHGYAVHEAELITSEGLSYTLLIICYNKQGG
jgi:hypothetical protein